ncbi:hypothetical protein ACQEVF_27495 [Nonomuraea polychroma]|uniref:hypothetical protein n=1 Tax=Nonomuraea polychroma TaxID=46176 RepID=UPI003D8FBED8
MKTGLIYQTVRSRLTNRVRQEKTSAGAGGFAIAPAESLLLAAVRKPIVLAVTAAVLLRAVVILAHQQAFWYGDSGDFVANALQFVPGPLRPFGYSMFVRMLLPFHSNVLIAVVQHVMGLGMGILVYVLLRRWRVRPMPAVLAALPVLFEPRQLAMEHALLSETLFTSCVIGVVAVTLWRQRLTVPAAVLAGLLLAAATLTRSIALPLVVIYLLFLLVRRVRLRTLIAAVASCLAPLFAYGLWFQAHHGVIGVTSSDGLILWSRTMSFADCAEIRPPAALVPLCPPKPHQAAATWPWNFLLDTKLPGHYITNPDAWLYATDGPPAGPDNNSLARQFALRAIVAQPVDYVLIVARDVAHTFLMTDPPFDTNAAFRFSGSAFEGVPPQHVHWAAAYGYGDASTGIATFSTLLRWYERWIFLPGLVLFAVMVAPLVFAVRYKRLPGRSLLPWMMAVALSVLAIATNQGDYRYVQPAIPLACIATAYILARAKALRLIARRTNQERFGRDRSHAAAP